jgi:hypothetical protein
VRFGGGRETIPVAAPTAVSTSTGADQPQPWGEPNA